MRQTNATLRAIYPANPGTAGGRDDYDAPVAPGAGGTPASPARWTGAERVYLREKVTQTAGAGGLDVVTRRTVILRTALLDTLALDTEDLVELERDDAPELLRSNVETIGRVAPPLGADVPDELVTSRVELEPA